MHKAAVTISCILKISAAKHMWYLILDVHLHPQAQFVLSGNADTWIGSIIKRSPIRKVIGEGACQMEVIVLAVGVLRSPRSLPSLG